MTRFVIITPGRSGSTFLAKSLNTHPAVVCEEEIFNRSESYTGSFNHFVRSHSGFRLLGFFFNREKLSTLAINWPLKWMIQKFLSRKSTGGPIYGFKLSLDQLFAYPQLLQVIRHYRVIYLVREDRVRMVLSLMASRATGDYESFSGKKITLDPKAVATTLRQLQGWEKKSLARFPDSLVLTAEALFSNPTETMQKIQEMLALPAPLVPIESSKAHPDSISDWIENYEEIQTYLKS